MTALALAALFFLHPFEPIFPAVVMGTSFRHPPGYDRIIEKFERERNLHLQWVMVVSPIFKHSNQAVVVWPNDVKKTPEMWKEAMDAVFIPMNWRTETQARKLIEWALPCLKKGGLIVCYDERTEKFEMILTIKN